MWGAKYPSLACMIATGKSEWRVWLHALSEYGASQTCTDGA